MMTRRLSALCLALATAAPLSAATLLPDYGAATFVPGARIDNPYFPVIPGDSYTLHASGTDLDGPFEESSIHSSAGSGPTLLGVETTAVLDRAYEDDVLVEETLDYYAQDSVGNVWYFGEDVTNFVYDDAGNLIETNNSSAWLAGVNDALPGYIMPADPVVGLSYFQEFAAADAALDEAVIHSVGATVALDFGTFDNVLVTFETTSLDPAARELKYYAQGYGLIRVEEGVDANFANAELTFNRTSPAPVPLPAGLPLLLGALGALGFRGRLLRAWLRGRPRSAPSV